MRRRSRKARRERTPMFVLRYSSRSRDAITLAEADVVVSLDLDLDATPRIVTRVVGGHVAEQILIAELFKEIGERVVELVDVVGEERAAAGRRGEAIHDSLQVLEGDTASLTDHVHLHVARLQAPLDVEWADV